MTGNCYRVWLAGISIILLAELTAKAERARHLSGCTAEDREALIERLCEDAWWDYQAGNQDPRSFEQDFWAQIFHNQV